MNGCVFCYWLREISLVYYPFCGPHMHEHLNLIKHIKDGDAIPSDDSN